MSPIKLPDFGIFIRKSSLEIRNIPRATVLKLMESEIPHDEDETLISFGPHFGGEALSVFISRLESLQLIYGEDFYDFLDNMPEWCQLMISLYKE